MIRTKEELIKEVERMGILPFFTNRVPGWSLEERIDPGKWFTDDDGPWEWKGPVAYEKRCVYGKFVRNKAAFVSLEWFPELANYRRGGFITYEDREEAEEAPHSDSLLMRYVAAHPGELSKYAKRECGFSKSYDAVLTRLEMQTYIVNQDFRYSIGKHGMPYGWGNAALIRPEDWLELDLPEDRAPEESFERIIAHLVRLIPTASEAALRREMK